MMADMNSKIDDLSRDTDIQDESTNSGGQSSSNNNKGSYRQKYKRAWELDTELRDWLTACSTDAYAAYCRFCRAKLHAHKKGLLAHAKSAKHRKHITNPNLLPDGLALVPSDSYNVTLLNSNGDSGYANNGDLDDGESTKGSKRNYKGQRLFNDNWLREPAFKEWLRKVPTNKTKALCIACRCVVTAGRCELMKHTKAAKHKKAITEGPFEEVGDNDLHWLEAARSQDQNLPSLTYDQQADFRPIMVELPGMLVDDILGRLERHVPIEAAEKWDNVGIITKPIQLITKPIRVYNILLTIDLDEWIVDEAIKKQAQFILSYHPPIFVPIKSLNPDRWKDRAILMCNKNEITVYSPHTALDAISGGINDWLIAPFVNTSDASVSPITASKTNTNYDPSDSLGPILGMGRIVTLTTPVPLNEVVQRIKTHLDLTHVRLALSRNHTRDTRVGSIAACAGSGSSILKGCKADVWLTGEMSHHEVLEAIHNGTTVILCEHSNTERGFLRNWSQQLRSSVFEDQVVISVSELDRDPMRII